MNRTPLTRIAAEVYRQRLLVEGYIAIPVDGDTIRAYFDGRTGVLGLRTYGEPIVHRTSGQGREINERFDGFGLP